MADPVTLRFLKAGMLTLVQDGGRPGYRAFGVPTGGALDRTAACIANRLVGNPPGGPLLEITLLGPEVAFDGPCQIALTGADLSASLGDTPIPRFETVDVEAGAVLRFGPVRWGCRMYLAVGGHWQVPQWLGSASAFLHAHTPCASTSPITAGQEIQVVPTPPVPRQYLPEAQRRRPTNRLRVLPGPEYARFSEAQTHAFFSQPYRVTPASNRMGYRLQGPALRPELHAEIITSPVLPGTIQVPHEGQPILLLADAQTSGGYPRLATVITADLDAAAQCKPGDTLTFTPTTLEATHQALMAVPPSPIPLDG